MRECDIAIVGGGLVGASLALALAPRWRVVVLEGRQPPAVPEGDIPAGPWDERCLALNDGSRRIYQHLGLWPALQAQAAPIVSTQISERGRFGVARFSAAEAGLEALGWNTPLRVIATALWQQLQASECELLSPARVRDVSSQATHTTLEVALEDGGQEIDTQLRTRLVVAADGADSTVREKLGVGSKVRDYHQHAIVSAVRINRPHRGVAYERFIPDGPFAILPKAVDACSMIHTIPSTRLDELMALNDAAYLQCAQAIFGGRLGHFAALGRRMPHPLKRVLSQAGTAPRAVFIGNAAQNLHPVAAQGFNLGLRDAANLAAMLEKAEDPGDAAVLADFATARAADRSAARGITDVLVRTFSNRAPGLAQLRHWGLLGAQLVPPIHQHMLRQHLGHRGLPPWLGDD